MTDSVKYGARWTFPAQDSAEWVEARKKAAAEPGAALLFAYCGLQEYPDPQVCAWTAVVCKAHHEVLVELKEAKEEIARLKGQAVSSQPAADEVYIRAYVAQAERVLQLEAALRELRDEHGCDCGDEGHEEGCPIKTISAALKGE